VRELDDSGDVVVDVVGFLAVVVVVVGLLDFLEPDFGLAVVAVVEDDGGSTGAVAVVVVDDDEEDGAAAAAAPGSTRDPAAAPGRGSVLAGDAGAGVDVAPAEGRAGAASVGGEVGGVAVSGEGLAATSSASSATGTDRAAWRARRTSGWESGDTRAVEKRDETSCTPNSPRSTPLAVPRAHVITRTRRTFQCSAAVPNEHAKTRLNQCQDGRLGG
jgi:hypothetical protein